MCKLAFIMTFLLLSQFTVYSQVFSNGSTLINMDNKGYEIIYTELSGPSTRICNCIKPTATMKNGIVSASMRNRIPGFKITCVKNNDNFTRSLTAVIEPKTTVNCLSVYLQSVEISGIGKVDKLQDKTIVISNGKLFVRKNK